MTPESGAGLGQSEVIPLTKKGGGLADRIWTACVEKGRPITLPRDKRISVTITAAEPGTLSLKFFREPSFRDEQHFSDSFGGSVVGGFFQQVTVSTWLLQRTNGVGGIWTATLPEGAPRLDNRILTPMLKRTLHDLLN